jgi:enterochelin esterase-like enzyme
MPTDSVARRFAPVRRHRRVAGLLAAAAAAVSVPAAGLATGTLARGETPSAPVVHEQTFQSAAVSGTLHYRVYLPSGYANGSRRYPVVYLLGGLPDAGSGYRDSRLQAVGSIAERAGHPVIVIAPQASRPGDTDPEYHDWGRGRNWETAISSELVSTADGRYRTITDRSARALIGVSAGGYGATIIALHHPGTFSIAQSWSGYFFPTNPAGTARLSVGGQAANRRASVYSYVSLLGSSGAVTFSFYVGDSDPDFLDDNVRLDGVLVRAGLTHRFAVYAGGHTTELWSAHEQVWVEDAVSGLARAA